MNERPPLRVAVIGCGRMGQRRAEAVAQRPGTRLVVVVDTDRPRAESLASRLGCEHRSDPADLPDRSGLDAVFVSIPNHLHAPVVTSALQRGLHVFCEKPLALTSAEAREMNGAAERGGLRLQVGSNLRHFGNLAKAKELLAAGALGRILFVRGWIGHDGWVLEKEPWSREPRQIGGGTLIDNGSHMVDILRWLVGEPTVVSGFASRALHRLEDGQEDNFVAILHGPRHELVTFQCSWTDWNGYLYLEICGESGLLSIDNRAGRSVTTLLPRGGPAAIFDYSHEGPVSFQREVDSFLTSVATGAPAEPSGADGVRVLEVIEELYASSRRNGGVSVAT